MISKHCFVEDKKVILRPLGSDVEIGEEGNSKVRTFLSLTRDTSLYLVRLKSGDFIICSINQKFYTYGVPVSLSLNSPIVKPFRLDLYNTSKHIGSLWPFRKEGVGYIFTLIHRSSSFTRNAKIAGILTKLWLLRRRLILGWEPAAELRSLACLHGFNLINKKNYFIVKFRRRRRSTLVSMDYLYEGVQYNVSKRNDKQSFKSSGFKLTK